MQEHTNPESDASDLLAVFDRVQVRRQEQITAADHAYCLQQQTALHRTLDRLQVWHDQFKAQIDSPNEDYRISYKPNGKADVQQTQVSSRTRESDYRHFEFIPVEAFNAVLDLSVRAQRRFTLRIIDYFNEHYRLAIPTPDLDDTPPMDQRPEYAPLIEYIMGYLDGSNFREKAREEIIQRLLGHLRWKPAPRLRGASVSFYNMLTYNSCSRGAKIDYDNEKVLNTLCAALALFGDDRPCGDSSIIGSAFRADNVDFTLKYELSTSGTEAIRFYKNGRIDVTFAASHHAAACFELLRLYTLNSD